MEQTREKILETLVDLLADETLQDFSVATVAERAKISVRTAYRYFPTKDALLDAFHAWLPTKIGTPVLPTTLAEMPEMAAVLATYWQTHERMMRAGRSIPAHELRKRRKADQAKGLKKMAAKAAPNLDADQLEVRAAALHQIIGSDVWLAMRDHWGLTQEQSIEAMRWGMRTLIAQLLADDAKARKRK